jgi:hypothetical protein
MIAGPRLASSICGSPRISALATASATPISFRSQEYSALQFRESVDHVSERRRHAFRWGASQFLTEQFHVGLVRYIYKGYDSGSAEASDQSARPTVQILWQRSFPGAPSHSARLFERQRFAANMSAWPFPRTGAKNASDRPALAGLYIAAATYRLSVARIETTLRSSWSRRWPQRRPLDAHAIGVGEHDSARVPSIHPRRFRRLASSLTTTIFRS